MSNGEQEYQVQEEVRLYPSKTARDSIGYKVVRYSLYFIYAALPLCLLGYLLNVYIDENSADQWYTPDFPSSAYDSSRSGHYDDINVEFHDLGNYRSTGDGWNREERVLFLVPLRDASSHLPMFFGHMKNITYPHNLIDLAFLISDTSDSTIPDLKRHLREIQNNPDTQSHFGRINIYEKDFGQIIGQSFSDRHGFQAQGPRRKLMAIARNWLLTTALRPDHSWVYWRDADVETIPPTIIEDLMHHDKDVIVPNVWRPLPDWLGNQQPYDLNSWQESEGGIELADKLDEDAVIVEGYSEYATWRPHLAYLRDPLGDPEVEIELDGIGGVSILSKANVFKSGAMFPAFSYQKHAETEAFGKLCKTMGLSVVGLPHYTIWHIYEPSSDDLKHMEWMEEEQKRRTVEEKNKAVYDKQWKAAFDDVETDWTRLKFNVFKNTDLSKYRDVQVDWDDVDQYLMEVADDVDNSDKIDILMQNKEFEQSMLQRINNRQSEFGESDGEEVFSQFPLYKYGGRGSKNYKFVKFEGGPVEEDINGGTEQINSGMNEETREQQRQEDQKQEDQKQQEQRQEEQRQEEQRQEEQRKEEQRKEEQRKEEQRKEEQRQEEQKQEEQKQEEQKQEQQRQEKKKQEEQDQLESTKEKDELGNSKQPTEASTNDGAIDNVPAAAIDSATAIDQMQETVEAQNDPSAEQAVPLKAEPQSQQAQPQQAQPQQAPPQQAPPQQAPPQQAQPQQAQPQQAPPQQAPPQQTPPQQAPSPQAPSPQAPSPQAPPQQAPPQQAQPQQAKEGSSSLKPIQPIPPQQEQKQPQKQTWVKSPNNLLSDDERLRSVLEEEARLAKEDLKGKFFPGEALNNEKKGTQLKATSEDIDDPLAKAMNDILDMVD